MRRVGLIAIQVVTFLKEVTMGGSARVAMLGVAYPTVHQREIRGCRIFYCRVAGEYHSLGSDGTVAVQRERERFLAEVRRRWVKAIPALFGGGVPQELLEMLGGNGVDAAADMNVAPAGSACAVSGTIVNAGGPSGAISSEAVSPRMADVFESALEVVESMRAKRTVEHYRVATRDFLEFFGEDVRWQEVTHVRLREWRV